MSDIYNPISIEGEPFLSPSHVERILEAQSVASAIELGAEGNGSLSGQTLQMSKYLITATRDLQRGFRSIQGVTGRPEEKPQVLAEVATGEVIRSTLFEGVRTSTVQKIATDRVYRDADERFYGAGTELVRTRANQSTVVMGLASGLLVKKNVLLDGSSVWREACETYELTRGLRSPVTIGEEEAARHSDYIERLDLMANVTGPVPGTGEGLRGLRKVFRHIRHVRKEQELGLSMADIVLTAAGSMPYREAEELSDEERGNLERTLDKQESHIKRAAQANSRVAENPVTAFFLFLKKHMGTPDPRRAEGAFEKDIKRATKALEKRRRGSH